MSENQCFIKPVAKKKCEAKRIEQESFVKLFGITAELGKKRSRKVISIDPGTDSDSQFFTNLDLKGSCV